MKNIAEEALETKGKEIFGFVPIDNILETFDEDFLKMYLRESEKRGIVSKSIRSKSLPSGSPYGKKPHREIRIAPADMKLSSTITIFDNKVAVFSAPEHQFAFVVESDEFAQTMKNVFKAVWEKLS